jgi:lipid II:glycine glycyltransferase (peptidoglycan interpeptide bridge formation enzyme)
VNFFGQKRIASFLPRMEVYSHPLVYKLKESTYKQYKQFWKWALALIAIHVILNNIYSCSILSAAVKPRFSTAYSG